MTHADIACQLVSELPPGVFAHAALDAVAHADFVMLERMLPGVRFSVHPLGVDRWRLTGVCADGSMAVWTVGP